MIHRIAIDSIYRIINYGSTMQATALRHVVKGLGYQCSHIRYVENICWQHWFRRICHNAYDTIRLVCNDDVVRRYRFEKFWNRNLSETSLANSEKTTLMASMYDAFICGSDQIWAPNQFNPYYFLDFVKEPKKKIAYAPSIGLPRIPDHLCGEYVRLISSIPYLSVRGDEDAALLKRQFGIKAESVLDPTLLLSAGEWESYMSRRRIGKGDYIFCYMLGDECAHMNAISLFARQMNMHVIVVAPHLKKAVCRGADIRCDLGPAEWLRAVKDARYVITDSYHGMLFSIIFKKEFCEILRFSDDDPICQNSRVISIANKFNLNSRVLPFGRREITWPREQIDYESVYKVLNAEKCHSMNFLRNALSKATGGKI